MHGGSWGMLFHIQHRHEGRDCIAHKPDDIKQIVGAMMAKAERGVVDVKAFVVDAPNHHLYWIVEAETVEALHDFLDSALEWGQATTVPVDDGLEAIRRRTE